VLQASQAVLKIAVAPTTDGMAVTVKLGGHQGGGRLVGIISHVPELKERIKAWLEVIPGRGGSTARFFL